MVNKKNLDLSKAFELSEINDETVNYVFGVVVEEVGEIATSIYRPEKAPEPSIREIADAILALLDLGMKVDGGGLSELQHAIDEKTLKWEKKILGASK